MVWKCPNTAVKVRTIEIRPTFGQNKLEWIRHNKMAYDINQRVTKLPITKERIDHMDW